MAGSARQQLGKRTFCSTSGLYAVEGVSQAKRVGLVNMQIIDHRYEYGHLPAIGKLFKTFVSC